MSRRFFSTTGRPLTLFDKIWKAHVVDTQEDGTCLLYIDRHLVHEVTSPQAFEGLRNAERQVRRKDCTLATADHNVPTVNRAAGITEPESKLQVDTLEDNVKEFDLQYFGMDDVRQGIVHIIGPEQGFTQPGMTIVCGDSHTATHGAFGALAFGIGTSEVEHVLATQTLLQKPAKNMRIYVEGDLGLGVTSKDLILHIIGVIGTAGGTGHVIEYAGEAVRKLSMEGRMTMCNMSIEGGARAGMVAPDDITFNYLRGRPMSPSKEHFEKAVEYWRTFASDEGAVYDTEVHIEAADIIPQVTWGTSPQDVVPITGSTPNPDDVSDPDQKATIVRALKYMNLRGGQRLDEVQVDKVFIGSCTNGRIEDLREVAAVAKGRKVASNVHALVVPGSGLVKQQAEDEGVADVLREAGFDLREPGCSMCLAMNADRLEPGERCASTSNRNFEGRQGRGGLTHLVSPGMAAAAAVTGRLADVRTLLSRPFSTGSRARSPLSPRGHATHQRRFSTTPSAFEPFTVLKGIAAPLPVTNVDTDMIIPKQFLKTIKRTGLGKSAFHEMRTNEDGTPNPDFVLNKEPYNKAVILVTGPNFGCGSSREHAPWALLDFGLRCIIAESFADIFYNNCFKNGMLPLQLNKASVETLMADAEAGHTITVDLLENKVVRETGDDIPFEVEDFRRHCLIHALDDIGLTMQKNDLIDAFEEKRKIEQPWL